MAEIKKPSRVAVGMPRTGVRVVRGKSGGRVAVGLSGGVDSSVAAALLVEQGYDVTGVHLICWEEPGCRAPQDHKDALSVALELCIPFEVLDFKKEYKEKVIDYFYREYQAGRTPNPDVACNREIKFGLFLQWAVKNGFDYIATGHYARSDLTGESRERYAGDQTKQGLTLQYYRLLQGVDQKKDQSYFLYTLTQEQLRHILFPVGNLTKLEVRKEAKKRGLVTADKPDSVGICFIGDVDVQEFLRRRIKEKTGDVVDTDGDVIGKHKGVWFYTIGQRHGFSISHQPSVISHQEHAIPPFYVMGKDVTRNRLIVGFGQETYLEEFESREVHWISGERITDHQSRVKDGNGLRVRIRHGGDLIPAMLENSKFEIPRTTSSRDKRNSKLLVRLSKPVRGIAPGQAVVFYNEDECLGGGTISTSS